MTIARSIVLFALAALLEIAAPGWSGKADASTKACGGSLPVSSPLARMGSWPRFKATRTSEGSGRLRRGLRRRIAGLGVIVDKFRPDRYDLIGAAICLAGVNSTRSTNRITGASHGVSIVSSKLGPSSLT
jgi:small multidrug resistance family-3 protein